MNFYEDYHLDYDGETLYPTRGHGLGMANSLTSLIQEAVISYSVEEAFHEQ